LRLRRAAWVGLAASLVAEAVLLLLAAAAAASAAAFLAFLSSLFSGSSFRPAVSEEEELAADEVPLGTAVGAETASLPVAVAPAAKPDASALPVG